MARSNVNDARVPTAVCMLYDAMRASQTRVEIASASFRIGRAPCEIECNFPFIPEIVASIRREDSAWVLSCYATDALKLNGVPMERGRSAKLSKTTRLEIGTSAVGTVLNVVVNFPETRKETTEERVQRLDDAITEFANKTHTEILQRMRDALGDEAWKRKSENTEVKEQAPKKLSDKDEKTNVDDELVGAVEAAVEDVAREFGFFKEESRELVGFMAGVSIRDQAIKRLLEGKDASVDVGLAEIFDEGRRHYGRFLTAHPELEKRMEETGDYVLRNGLKIAPPPNEFDADGKKKSEYDEEYEAYLRRALDAVEGKYWKYWFSVVDSKITNDFAYYLALRYLKKTIKDLIFGYGPLEDLLRTPSVSEIMVVNYKTIFIERNGRIENSGRRFFSEEISEKIINDIVKRVNREVNASTPIVDARLVDGSRVNAVIAPLAVGGSCLTIRRFPTKRLTIQELVEKKDSMSQAAAEFLRASILARKNILVSGGTGTGKTTLLNCLCDYIPDNERIVTVEDTVELRIAKRHVVRLEAKTANAEGKGAYTIRDLVKNALRMRPDRVIVGECRGGEALDMLQAMNTGHDGSLTTIHANSAKDSILRLETLVLQSDAKLPIESIDRQIASAIDLIVQLKRMRKGRRCVSQIVEVTDIDPENGEIRTREIYKLDSDASESAKLRPTGSLPSYMNVLIAKGWLDLEKFYFD